MIKVFLMGTPTVHKEDRQISFAYKKEEGLFYFLCMEGTVTRNQAAGIFWADCSDQTARKNLRNALYHLRRLLGEDVLKLDGSRTVELDREQVWVDVWQLREDNIRENYRGDFLGYFYIKNCVEFEEWMDKERYRLKRMYVRACKDYVMELIEEQDLYRIQGQYEILLDNSVYDESIYRGIMALEMRAGRYNEAAWIYQKLKTALQTELDSAPERETEELYRKIQDMKEQAGKTREQEKEDYFYGRREELRRLRRQLGQLLDDSGQGEKPRSVVILGEAGVGKTCLLREFEQWAHYYQVLLLHYDCAQSGEGLNFRPWYEICMQMQAEGIGADFEAGYRERILGRSRDWNTEFFSAQLELFVESVFREAVEKQRRKILLVFDDLQWMDASSQQLLSSLVYHLGGEHLLLVGACRSDCREKVSELLVPLLAQDRLEIMELSCFSLEESREIVSYLMPDLARQPGVMEKIYHTTEGNGLFLTETVKLFQHGDVKDASRLHSFSAGMVNIIQSRLLPLGENDRRILDALSIQAEFMTLDDLKAVVRMPELEIADGLDRLMRAQFLSEKTTEFGLGYSFVHRLIQDYIYDNLSQVRRQTSHRMLAEHLEEELRRKPRADRYPYVVYHFQRCGEIYKMYLYKLKYFTSFYTIYHEVYPDLAEYVGTALWQQQMTNGEALEQAAAEIRELCRDNGDEKMQELRMQAEYLIGRCAIACCDYEKGLGCASLGLEIAYRLGDTDFIYKCNLLKIFYGIQVLDLPLMEQCLEEIEPCSRENLEKRGTWLRLKGLYLIRMGRHQEGRRVLGEAIRSFEMLGEERRLDDMVLAACYNYLGESFREQGDVSQARSCLEKAIMLGSSGQTTNGNGVFFTNMAELLMQEGQYGEAEKYARMALRTFQQTGALWGRERLEACLALLAWEKGAAKEAGEHLEYAREAAEKIANPEGRRLVEKAAKRIIGSGK